VYTVIRFSHINWSRGLGNLIALGGVEIYRFTLAKNFNRRAGAPTVLLYLDEREYGTGGRLEIKKKIQIRFRSL